MATKPSAAAAASLPPPNNNDSRSKTVTVKCIWWNKTKTLDINLIFHNDDQPSSKSLVTPAEEEDDDARKYSLCSLLLQLGKVFQIQPPPYAPSPRLSSIFNKLLERWSLQRVKNAQHHDENKKKIEGLSEIQDGDELLFLFGDYFQKISLSRNKNDDDNGDDTKKKTEEGVDLFELLPKKYNLVTVEVINNSRDQNDNDGKEGQKNNNNNKKNIECIEILSSSSDDEVEDVTDMYVKSRPSPEVIEVEDASDSDESEWEKDEYGNLRRPAAYFEKKRKGNNDSKSRSRGDDNSQRDNCSMSGSKKSSSSANDNTSMFDSDGDSDEYYASNDDDDDDDSSIEDVTDIMRAQKQKEQQKMMEEAELLETDSEEEDTTKKRKRKNHTTQGGKRRKVQLSPIEVVIEDEDLPACPGAAFEEEDEGDNQEKEGNTDVTNDVDLSIKQRIIKLLNTGLHNESNEHEARNAMKLARRLLDRYNLDQAVLLKERGNGSLNDFSTTNDKDNGSALHGGIVTVNILNRKKTVPLSSMPRWLESLIAPVIANFRVDAFVSFSKATRYTSCGKCSVSFFGIKTNAQLAAYAFKTAAERIAFMTASYEPPRSEGARKQASQTRTARLSYALGMVAGLDRDVKREIQEEEQKRQEDLRRARNAAKTGEAYQEDVDCNDDHGDEPQQQQQNTPVEEKLHQLENEHEARLALVDCNKKIAEDVLKSQKIKLSSRKKRSSISFNRLSYETGVVHSKEIDLNQKAIQQS
ncbi:hypothetical protein QTG54_009116 [Skeletonema marinoi]|uniref:DUF2786 domain-containing protein n=1 Tax=Skeletonema marinoi TaxID=267567 RepID=A0AAD8Y5M7_9STRA|nr:hypothetical protein QTG54_009116 [Skeletonema marinoi]